MHSRAFAACYVSVLLIVGFLLAPVGAEYEPLEADWSPAAGVAPRCLSLTYTPPAEDLPNVVRLVTQPADTIAGLVRFHAQRPSDSRFRIKAVWYPAGTDSIDIAVYHSPVTRLPSTGDTVIGYTINAVGYSNLFSRLTESRPKRKVLAVRVVCEESVWAGVNREA